MVYRGTDICTHSFHFNIRGRKKGVTSMFWECRKRETEGLRLRSLHGGCRWHLSPRLKNGKAPMLGLLIFLPLPGNVLVIQVD